MSQIINLPNNNKRVCKIKLFLLTSLLLSLSGHSDMSKIVVLIFEVIAPHNSIPASNHRDERNKRRHELEHFEKSVIPDLCLIAALSHNEHKGADTSQKVKSSHNVRLDAKLVSTHMRDIPDFVALFVQPRRTADRREHSATDDKRVRHHAHQGVDNHAASQLVNDFASHIEQDGHKQNKRDNVLNARQFHLASKLQPRCLGSVDDPISNLLCAASRGQRVVVFGRNRFEELAQWNLLLRLGGRHQNQCGSRR
mmetsp:Transcript_18785/g.29817  ORF Transcript_18785/g.29817 Transcript_18785/m.29817 type:complete len:253 (-) Transcript_18785:28-786(-)